VPSAELCAAAGEAKARAANRRGLEVIAKSNSFLRYDGVRPSNAQSLTSPLKKDYLRSQREGRIQSAERAKPTLHEEVSV
jgi:hypothetical protein